jgi:hypothetical protein
LRVLGWPDVAIPTKMRWLFWEVDPGKIDVERHADYVIARVVEYGRLRT